MPIIPEPFHSYGEKSDSPIRQWSSIVGILTAIIGNILISFALNTQRYAHIRIAREYKNNQDPEAKQARKQLPKSLRNYGAAVQQEEIAEERARINEEAPHPDGEVDRQNGVKSNGKQHPLQDTSDDHNNNDTGQYDHDDNESDQEEHEGRKSYLRSPWWWFGIILMTIGEAGNFLAYGFAPASIVSPLGVVALISNCLIAPLMLKERFRQRDFWGVMIAIGGAVTVVFSAKTQEKQLGPDELLEDVMRWEFLAYVLTTVVLMVVLIFASPKYGQRTILINLGLVGLFGGYTVLSTKGVASLFSTSLYRAFTYPIFYVLVLILVTSAVLQIRYLNRALQDFDSTQVIPVQFVLFTLSAITGSAILYRDFERTNADRILKFIFGCLLTFGGVYLITSGRKREDEDDGESTTEDGERIRLLDEEAAEESTSPISQEHKQNLKLDTQRPQLDGPKTPKDHSPTSPSIPSIAVTPADSLKNLERNPWLSSTDNLDQIDDDPSPATAAATGSRPHTPIDQTIPSASFDTPQTAFYTPHTSKRRQQQQQQQSTQLSRTFSSPAQPETPTRRTASPPKPALAVEEENRPILRSGRHSITRLIPGPILQPLSSSLSGIVADRILKGEGTPSPRSTLRRHRSIREAPGRLSRIDLDGTLPNASASETTLSLQRSRTQESPLLLRRGQSNRSSDEVLVGDDPVRPKGRLRSMSETLANFMGRATGRRSSRDDDSNNNEGDSSGRAVEPGTHR